MPSPFKRNEFSGNDALFLIGFKQHKAMLAVAFVKAASLRTAGITVNPSVIENSLAVIMNVSQREIINIFTAESVNINSVFDLIRIFADLSVEHYDVYFVRIGIKTVIEAVLCAGKLRAVDSDAAAFVAGPAVAEKHQVKRGFT